MAELPPELLHEIFIYLDLQERLTCLTVCRNWWKVLDGNSLFYHLRLNEQDISPFSGFMEVFEHSPSLAAQVQELDLVILTDKHYNSRSLLEIFPNARVIMMDQHFDSLDSNVHQIIEHVDMTHLKPRVESLLDIHPFYFVSQIIYSNLGGRLKELTLDFFSVSDSSTKVSQLKDLPVLKTLTLYTANINIRNIEEIHSNIPSIEDLGLIYLTVKPGNIPAYITPATRIKNLNICLQSVDNLRDHIQIYQYLTQKYTNITTIEYSDFTLGDNYPYDKKKLYLNGLVDFYKLIGPYTTRFNILCLPDGVNIFKALDAVGSKTRRLACQICEGGTIFQYLSQSDQSKHVQELDIWNINLDSIHLIKNMPSLTELTLGGFYSSGQPLHLSDCLNACPSSLKRLSIIRANLVVEPFNSNLDRIEKLYISCDTLPSDIGDIITSCFPNLIEFSLTFQVLENINITLKQPHLQRANFYVNDSSDVYFGFSLTSPNFTAPQYYHCLEDNTPAHYEEIQHLPILSVVTFKETTTNMDEVIILELK